MSEKPIILCVDDERTVLVSLKEQLRRSFGSTHLIETAESGELALELLDELRAEGRAVPVVVSDHIMPAMKGDEFLVRVHAGFPTARTIMLTGQASADAVGKAVNGASLFRFLSKPWVESDLVLTLRSAIESWEATRRIQIEKSTMVEINALALDLTRSFATHDRYRRLAQTVTRALGATDVALFRKDRDTLVRMDIAAPPISISDCPALEEDLAASSPVRRTDPREVQPVLDALGWTHKAPVLVTLPLRTDETPMGLLVASTSASGESEEGSTRLSAIAALTAASLKAASSIDALEATAARGEQVVKVLQREVRRSRSAPLLGSSQVVRQLREGIAVAAALPTPVLIEGGVGSGRSEVALAIHAQSQRRDRVFLKVDCPLATAADLFGGDGRLELARQGTLFLSGIDRLAPELQEKLAEAFAGYTDVRFVASTSRDLERRELLRTIRSSLWKELTATRIRVPALVERREDIIEIATHLAMEHAHRMARSPRAISTASRALLVRHLWPGNIGELDRVVERSVMTSTGDELDVDARHLDSVGSIGSYRLLAPLASGGMGEVWQAQHEHLARPAAVKFVRSEESLSEADRQRFLREAQVTARLRSPHTVALYDFGIATNGELFYVMELLEGLNLAQLVEEHGPLPPERAIHFLVQACRSLEEAHGLGLIHRDIKPANLFVSRLGTEVDFLKVLDFGAVEVTAEAVPNLTRHGAVLGTPLFVAPERMNGQGPVDGRVDIYALGITAYWLMAGQLPFGDRDLRDAVARQMRDDAPPLSALALEPIPQALDAILLSCIDRDPNRRPATAADLADALEAIVLPQSWTRKRARNWWRTHGVELTQTPSEHAANTQSDALSA